MLKTSGSEMERYLPSDDVRMVKPTAFAISHGAYTNGSGNCAWWLRSPGMTETSPAYIASAGSVGNRAHEMDETISPLETGLDFGVKMNKDFIGRDAIAARKNRSSVQERVY